MKSTFLLGNFDWKPNIKLLFALHLVELECWDLVNNPSKNIRFKTKPGTVAKNATLDPLVGIEPAALRFRSSAVGYSAQPP